MGGILAMWECMVLAFKVAVGGFLWWLAFVIVILVIGAIFYLFNREGMKKFNEKHGVKKPKWDGKPIVVEGEKKQDE